MGVRGGTTKFDRLTRSLARSLSRLAECLVLSPVRGLVVLRAVQHHAAPRAPQQAQPWLRFVETLGAHVQRPHFIHELVQVHGAQNQTYQCGWLPRDVCSRARASVFFLKLCITVPFCRFMQNIDRYRYIVLVFTYLWVSTISLV